MQKKFNRFGIIGGMGTVAGLGFNNRLIEEWTKAKSPKKEWDYPNFKFISNPKLPSRTLGVIFASEDDYSKYNEIKEGLYTAGMQMKDTDEFYILCNTAHYFTDKVSALCNNFVSIIELACEGQTDLFVLSGEGTKLGKLYDKYTDVEYCEHDETLRNVIEAVKLNKVTYDTLHMFGELLHKDKPNVMGCTEFSELYYKHKVWFKGYEIIDPLEILINRIIEKYD